MDTNILYIGRDPKMCAILHRLLNAREGWNGFTALTNAEAFEVAKAQRLSVVLLGSGITDDEERVLRGFFGTFPDLKIIQHYGGGSGLLYNEILQVVGNSHD
ncbi:hypothetical protein [Pedobacter sp. SYP-B3415]|uniref:hypothetical protein n=1 Tax=Pedobacter sp. SYP-B3415 TaxID=2496641 RepID=UPI00101CAFBB|nr:hypothetical protein [Pedobacter sp. SYP-B3415]